MAKYFTLGELCRSDTAVAHRIENTPDNETITRLNALMDECLDKVRSMWGKPIGVNSGYRSAELNRAVGGVKNSQHMRGEAADITTGTKENNRKLFDLIVASDIPFDQLIEESDYRWLHISYCKGDNRKEVLHYYECKNRKLM
jgi:hypothetical protein